MRNLREEIETALAGGAPDNVPFTCPGNARIKRPVATSHSIAVPSMLPDARYFPSWLTAAVLTTSPCPICTTISGTGSPAAAPKPEVSIAASMVQTRKAMPLFLPVSRRP